MTGFDHLSHQVEISAEVRDRLRDELGAYGCGTIMLDGVSRDDHQSLVTNSVYRIVSAEQTVEPPMQDETLFDLVSTNAVA